MAIKEFVPQKAGFVIYILFGLIFQLSGGIYLALAGQMTGSLVILREDVMYIGYSSFVGMTVVFPLLFRLKFRFTNKTLLLSAAIGLIICNIITMNSASIPVLVITSFFAGMLRVMGFFECLSTIQLKITPTRDFAKFFPVVYGLVLGSVQLSGLIAGYIAYYYNWQFMNLLAIGMLSVVAIACMLLYRHFRPQAPQPLTGIDWLGCFLWSLLMMLLIFVLEYGEHYEWLDSYYIRFAITGAVIILIFIFVRSKYIKQPFIDFHAFKYRHVGTLIFLFTSMCILLATPNILQNAFTGAILHYDMLNNLSLSWAVLAGIAGGAIFSYLTLVKLECSFKFVTNIGFVCILFYLIPMYFLISPVTSKEMFYIPMFFRGAGNTIIYVVLTVYASRNIPFIHFFQVLAIFGFFRTCLGGPIGGAILDRMLLVSTKKDMMSLSGELDSQNSFFHYIPLDRIANELSRQSLMVSIKEVYGYAVVAGIFILLLALSTRYRNLLKFKMPRWE